MKSAGVNDQCPWRDPKLPRVSGVAGVWGRTHAIIHIEPIRAPEGPLPVSEDPSRWKG